MKCPVCATKNMRSTVTQYPVITEGSYYTTYIYDEDGHLLRPEVVDSRVFKTPYACSKGHKYEVVSRNGYADEYLIKDKDYTCSKSCCH